MDTLTIRRPDDAHLHVRDGDALPAVVPHTAAVFTRAVIMPNLRPPIRTVADADAYRARIVAAAPSGFQPLMTLYLTDTTTADDVRAAAASPHVVGIKLYPAGATTHSDAGVTDLQRLTPVFDTMAEVGLPLLVHAESTDPSVDVFDREAAFLDGTLGPMLLRHPALRCVVEHVTTTDGVAFVRGARDGVAATITPQHLLLNRNALFQGGLRPHHYCLPVLKREEHRLALVAAATSGDPRFFLGTDSAPHARDTKEAACGCAGCYTALHALPLYALAFERAGALHLLEAFASEYAARFYGLPPNPGTVTLLRDPYVVPDTVPFPGDTLVPLFAGEVVPWRVGV